MRYVFAIMLVFTATLHAQAPTTFREGVIAFEKKDWKEAERLMRATIAGNPNESEGTVSIAGSWFETYVPHYFLARALARQGKCAEALQAFDETIRQGVSMTIPDFARHVETRGGCKPQTKAAKPKEVVLEATVPFGETAATTPSSPPATTNQPLDRERNRLITGIKSYLHGRYEESARVLTEAQFTDRAAAAEAALFRAAARHALYRMSGGQDAGLRAQFETDLRRYRELRPNGKPDARMFSPAFVALVSR